MNQPFILEKFPDEKYWIYLEMIDEDNNPFLESLVTSSFSVTGYEKHETGSIWAESTEIVESGSALVSGSYWIGAAIESGSTNKKYRIKYTGTTDTGNVITQYLYVNVENPIGGE